MSWAWRGGCFGVWLGRSNFRVIVLALAASLLIGAAMWARTGDSSLHGRRFRPFWLCTIAIIFWVLRTFLWVGVRCRAVPSRREQRDGQYGVVPAVVGFDAALDR